MVASKPPARELMSQPDVDGALVGASLEAPSFAEIVKPI
jgi:triosephosphate isomerase